MRKHFVLLAVLLLMVVPVAAWQTGTRTTNLLLFKPNVSSVNWGAEVNLNFDALDSVLSGTADAFGLRPNASGNDLGSTTRRWDAFLQDVDILSTADTVTGARALLLIHSDAIAGAGAHPFRLVHNTSGTPVNGIGAGIRFDAETTTTKSVEIGDMNFVWVNATHGVRTGAITFFLVDNAAAPVEVSRITSVGDYQWNSGTNFTGLLAHANTANRIYDFPDASTAIAGLAVTETFTAAQTFTGNVIVGTSGVAITRHLSGTASLDFTALAANTCEVLTIAVTNAADADTVTLGVPNALADVDGGTERTTFFGWVSAAGTVSVRRCNVTAGATADPAAATVRADAWQH